MTDDLIRRQHDEVVAMENQIQQVIVTTDEITKSIDGLTSAIRTITVKQQQEINKVKRINLSLIIIVSILIAFLSFGFYNIVQIQKNTNTIVDLENRVIPTPHVHE